MSAQLINNCCRLLSGNTSYVCTWDIRSIGSESYNSVAASVGGDSWGSVRCIHRKGRDENQAVNTGNLHTLPFRSACSLNRAARHRGVRPMGRVNKHESYLHQHIGLVVAVSAAGSGSGQPRGSGVPRTLPSRSIPLPASPELQRAGADTVNLPRSSTLERMRRNYGMQRISL